jgi:hypothetical protein
MSSFGNNTPVAKQTWLDSDLWYKDLQNQTVKNNSMATEQQGELIGEGFGALDNVTLQDPNDRAIEEGLMDPDPFAKTDSANVGILGGIAGGAMSVISPFFTWFGSGDKDTTPDAWRVKGSGNASRGWNATIDFLKGAGSKAEMAYYWKGTIPDGYYEDENGDLKKKKTPVDLKGYTKSEAGGSGFN